MTSNDRHEAWFGDAALENDLRSLARLEPRDDEFKDELRELLRAYARMAPDPATQHTERNASMALSSATIETQRRVRPLAWPRRLRLLILAALALSAGGTATYLHSQPAGHENTRPALTITAPAPPDKVVYEKAWYYGLNETLGVGSQPAQAVTDTVEQWTQYAANGAISRQAAVATSPTNVVLWRRLRLGRSVTFYVPRLNILSRGGVPRGGDVSAIDSPMSITDLRAFEAAVRKGTLQYFRLLPTTRLYGVAVHVIEYRGIEPLPKGAPKGIKPAQDVSTWYYEPGSYALRRFDEVWIDGHGATHPQVRILVTERKTIPATSVSAQLFIIHPAHAAKLILQSALTAVAEAATQSAIPAPLLGRDLYGLQLYELDADIWQGKPRFIYRYSAGARIFGNWDKRMTLMVDISRHLPSEPHSAQPWFGPHRQLLITRVGGHTVRASYFSQLTDNAGLTHYLVYSEGNFDVGIDGLDMSKQQFFAIVSALVDGHTHPATVAHLQHELDLP